MKVKPKMTKSKLGSGVNWPEGALKQKGVKKPLGQGLCVRSFI